MTEKRQVVYSVLLTPLVAAAFTFLIVLGSEGFRLLMNVVSAYFTEGQVLLLSFWLLFSIAIYPAVRSILKP